MTKTFRIYYSDKTYEGDPELAPERDIQAIIQPDEKVGWKMMHSADYYIYRNRSWRAVDIFGLFDYLASSGWKRVLFGRVLTDDEWKAVYKRVKADCEFGRKQGYLPDERRVDA